MRTAVIIFSHKDCRMKINATGCSLIDNLYSPVDFSSPGYRRWSAESGMKNGLNTGGLVFGEDLEESSGIPYNELLNQITGGKIRPEQNIGGPAVVAAIHMSQVLPRDGFSIGFYGCRGEDELGSLLEEKLKNFNMDISGYMTAEGKTPFTDVFSDPSYNNSNGERTFVNYIGAAGEIRGRDLPGTFFDADMLIFGGTALTPGLHDDLGYLLARAKAGNKITCVNTVYDFRNQKQNPSGQWPLVDSDDRFHLIDLLIADNEEAIKISGRNDKYSAAAWFEEKGVRSVIITHGSESIECCSDGHFFTEKGHFSMPVSEEAGRKMKTAPEDKADTTGCGDNFAGGVYASLASQLAGGNPSLREAVSFGAAAGGFAGLYCGGVFFEKYKGEKEEHLKPLIAAYKKQQGVEL